MSLSVNLKPSNISSISGCPGVPKTFPQFDSILEIRQSNADINQIYINTITIKFITIDSLKFSKSNTPNSMTKVNYELNYRIDSKIISLDLPFAIPINQNISPSLESNQFKVNHHLQVEITLMNKQLKQFEFPIVINKYDNLPIYRQFNQPISKIIDSKDSLFFLEFSLPFSSIGPQEFLKLNLKITKSKFEKKNALKLKKITLEVVELFDCRCDNSFIKENIIKHDSFEFDQYIEEEFEKNYNINLTKNLTNPYLLFNKHQDPKLLTIDHPTIPMVNNLKPMIIDHDSKNPVPFTSHNNYQTFKSNFFQVYYQVNVKIKYNRSKSLSFQQPFTVSNHSRIESMDLIKWILKESQNVNENDFIYDSKYDVFKRPKVPKMTIMRSKEDKVNFI